MENQTTERFIEANKATITSMDVKMEESSFDFSNLTLDIPTTTIKNGRRYAIRKAAQAAREAIKAELNIVTEVKDFPMPTATSEDVDMESGHNFTTANQQTWTNKKPRRGGRGGKAAKKDKAVKGSTKPQKGAPKTRRKGMRAINILSNFLEKHNGNFDFPAFHAHVISRLEQHQAALAKDENQEPMIRVYSFLESILHMHDTWTTEQVFKELLQIDKCERRKMWQYVTETELTVRDTEGRFGRIDTKKRRRNVKDQLRVLRKADDDLVDLFGGIGLDQTPAS